MQTVEETVDTYKLERTIANIGLQIQLMQAKIGIYYALISLTVNKTLLELSKTILTKN